MDYQEIVDYLYGLPRFTKGGHMDNVKKLLEALENPQDSFSYIHVAGTNGKGSVSAYMERCLRLCHRRTGLFTSPHLVRVNERMRICGREITDADFVRIFHQVDDTARRQMARGSCMLPTFFEYIYLMAMVYFKEQRIDYGIIEAGLGGRMDFTNAVGHPRLTVITPVGMDHVPVLGTTLAEIAREKAGIIKAGCPLVCGRQEAPALDVIKDCARRAGVPAVYLDDETIEIISDPGKNIDFSMKSGYHGKYTFSLNTTAVYQAENAALAVAALKELWKDPLLADEPFIPTVSGGLARTRWPGRMEALGERFYVDGAHNVAGIDAFVKTIARSFSRQPLYLVFAAAGDKDYTEMIRQLTSIPNLKGVVVTEIDSGRRAHHEETAEVFHKNWNGMITSTYNIKEAVSLGLLMRGPDGVLCCVGSLYLVGSIKEIAGGNSDDQL